MADLDNAQIFQEARSQLLGLAYRILGSLADAEDAVQDTFLKWHKADRHTIDAPVAWLTTVCTRRCLDLLRSAHKSRVDYVGTWLPEPIHTPIEEGVENASELAGSLTTAFLLTLERLTPKERAAYLLHDIFEVPYPEIAETLELKESACRQLVSRARVNIEQAKVRHATPLERQEQLLAAFEAAVTSGSASAFAALLSDDVQLATDGGGRVPALLEALHGKAAVVEFIVERLGRFWADYRWVALDINGCRGLVLRQEGKVVTVAAVSFAYDDAGRVTNIYIMRNPDKLSRLGETTY
ncbi:RNA polymerase sigma-70 factor, ECF subfamily [Modicisalibacter muralis]|uniref:RNA polymerase sigma-70 factor, ECF subfamily n=1 Tax=Modicisalibacter muralis TaxID=119000 RepID=A0A1G9I2S6_9GAMM|nr:RNA polymerase sigma factor SigJ [Halomonas muralis]SDL19540.1 RNA polymerase sigma-70 factor, ECF subfamily [Halomonas muralis]